MDPLSQALAFAQAVILLWTKYFDALPPDQKTQASLDMFKPGHNLLVMIDIAQRRLNDALITSPRT